MGILLMQNSLVLFWKVCYYLNVSVSVELIRIYDKMELFGDVLRM